MSEIFLFHVLINSRTKYTNKCFYKTAMPSYINLIKAVQQNKKGTCKSASYCELNSLLFSTAKNIVINVQWKKLSTNYRIHYEIIKWFQQIKIDKQIKKKLSKKKGVKFHMNSGTKTDNCCYKTAIHSYQFDKKLCSKAQSYVQFSKLNSRLFSTAKNR